MGLEELSSRAIQGMYFRKMEAVEGTSWARRLSFYQKTTQLSETYKFLGSTPKMREWGSSRHLKRLAISSFEITNQKLESTLVFDEDDVDFDSTEQIRTRINEHAQEPERNWKDLAANLLLNGGINVCHDGDYFFGTAHPIGTTGNTQSNLVSININAIGVPADEQGTPANPSAKVMSRVQQKVQALFFDFLDDQEKPIFENSSDFMSICPPSLYNPARTGAKAQALAGGETNTAADGEFQLDVVADARLRSLTTSFFMAVVGTMAPPFIFMERRQKRVRILDARSEHNFFTGEILCGVDAQRNAGYGLPESIIKVTLTQS